jgi:hypothetical protein
VQIEQIRRLEFWWLTKFTDQKMGAFVKSDFSGCDEHILNIWMTETARRLNPKHSKSIHNY